LRVFAPHHGVTEDPATGSAAVGFAGVVREFDDLRDGHHRKKLEQGIEMGRPSVISLSLEVGGGQLHTVRIGGNAVHVSEGVLTI
jgi:trans-2,3-dihydro-3-hydroxyanthranilate isomerase